MGSAHLLNNLASIWDRGPFTRQIVELLRDSGLLHFCFRFGVVLWLIPLTVIYFISNNYWLMRKVFSSTSEHKDFRNKRILFTSSLSLSKQSFCLSPRVKVSGISISTVTSRVLSLLWTFVVGKYLSLIRERHSLTQLTKCALVNRPAHLANGWLVLIRSIFCQVHGPGPYLCWPTCLAFGPV